MTANSFDGYVDILGPDDTSAPRSAPTAARGTRELPAYLARPLALIKAIPDVGTYLGVVLIVVGFVLLAICWGKVAGLTAIGYQMPYLASAGITGLALIVTGVAIVSAASRQKDASLRRAQMSELAVTLRTLRGLLEQPSPEVAVSAPPLAAELTTELAAILDLPLDDRDVVEVRRPVKATSRAGASSARSASAKRPAATSASRPAKTLKSTSR